MSKNKRVAIIACLLSIAAAIVITVVGFASPRAPAQAAAAQSCPAPIANVLAPVLESQDAVSCTAGGWQRVVSGWGPTCCGSTTRWMKFSGATPLFKCCGVCMQ